MPKITKMKKWNKSKQAMKSKGFKRYRSPLQLGVGNQVFPKTLKCKLHYSDLLNLQTASSAMTQLTYALNGMFDPYTAVGGHQPRYFDTLCGNINTNAPYYQYRVYGALIETIFVNPNTSTSTCGMVFQHARDSADNQLAAILDAFEMPNTVAKDFNSGYARAGTLKIKKYYDVGKLMSVTDIKDNENSIGNYNTNPTDLWVVDIGYQPYPSVITTNIFVRVNITYYCEFLNQNFVQAS